MIDAEGNAKLSNNEFFRIISLKRNTTNGITKNAEKDSLRKNDFEITIKVTSASVNFA